MRALSGWELHLELQTGCACSSGGSGVHVGSPLPGAGAGTYMQVCAGGPEGKVHGLCFPSQEQEFALKMLFISQGLIS